MDVLTSSHRSLWRTRGAETPVSAALMLMKRSTNGTPPLPDVTTITAQAPMDEPQTPLRPGTSPLKRSEVEIVSLLFHAILTEERIPAGIRVWFARLQMPVLRVATSEPESFASSGHPARRLVDRLGACAMGFDTSACELGDALENEIKRIVQVIEAFPDAGPQVFRTALAEFEHFLKHYFKHENEATRRGVSLLQQLEQREILAIRYSIDLRRVINKALVPENVRHFLFHVWADVMALTAMKNGGNSDETKKMRRAAADLVWAAGEKTSREERTQLIHRLPWMLKTLRDGMATAGLSLIKQDEHICMLNDELAAAFLGRNASLMESLMAS